MVASPKLCRPQSLLDAVLRPGVEPIGQRVPPLRGRVPPLHGDRHRPRCERPLLRAGPLSSRRPLRASVQAAGHLLAIGGPLGLPLRPLLVRPLRLAVVQAAPAGPIEGDARDHSTAVLGGKVQHDLERLAGVAHDLPVPLLALAIGTAGVAGARGVAVHLGVEPSAPVLVEYDLEVLLAPRRHFETAAPDVRVGGIGHHLRGLVEFPLRERPGEVVDNTTAAGGALPREIAHRV
eukprot:CAMPEP_0175280606 /NCGR_PEP_ID=MMETSP0093-20121207/50658_1 /TAXON_ID=311494 /ORGANISM="Alexandrium monilatum, Strain CCMP3105" /LENGTH=234 /DNA_ID=CAMNT_0016575693 /DNA_START=1 /DNA_END=705 /DNA_ORIENTATION=-